MRTEEKGSETHLQKAGLQMNTFPLTFPNSTSPFHTHKKQDSQIEMRGRGMTVLVLSLSLLSSPALFQSSRCCCPPLITSPCHYTGIFCFGFTCELLGEQIVYVSHPFLTAHFNDYCVFEFSQLFHVPVSSPSLWAGKCILPFNCIQNWRLREKYVNCPIALKKSNACI